MTKLVRKWPFNASMVADAPDHAGLYALWRGEHLVHLGRAEGGDDTIRARLEAHLARAGRRAGGGELAPPSHYSWEICADPATREQALAELTGQREDRHVGPG